MDGVMRTCTHAVSAADTLHAVGLFENSDVHLAAALTGAAFRTAVLINTEPVCCNRIKKSVEAAQRTQIFAERAIIKDSKQ